MKTDTSDAGMMSTTHVSPSSVADHGPEAQTIPSPAQILSGVSPGDAVTISVTNSNLSFVANGDTIQVPVLPGTVTFAPDVPGLGTFALDGDSVWQATSASSFAANGSHVLFTVASYQLTEDFTPTEGTLLLNIWVVGATRVQSLRPDV